jgi:hypothetical protein
MSRFALLSPPTSVSLFEIHQPRITRCGWFPCAVLSVEDDHPHGPARSFHGVMTSDSAEATSDVSLTRRLHDRLAWFRFSTLEPAPPTGR